MSRYVQQRFAESGEQIRRLYLADHEFRSLCHDYGVCLHELRKAELAVTPNSRKRQMEAHELIEEMESEIAEYLNASLTKSPSP